MFLKANHIAETSPREKFFLDALSAWCGAAGVFITERSVF